MTTGTLSERLKKQQEEQNAIIKDLTKRQRKHLLSWSKNTLKRELDTFETDIRRQMGGMIWRTLWSRMFWPSITGLAIAGGVFVGCWGLMAWTTLEIRESRQELRQMESRMEALNLAGVNVTFYRCGEDRRLCVQTDESAAKYKGGYRVLQGH